MPFSLKMSQDIFQHRIDQINEGLDGVVVIADDTIVFGETQQEYDANLHKMLECCLECGLKLSPEKLNVSQPEVRFFGVICGAKGVNPDPKKITALQSMSAPSDAQELLSFLGLGSFIPQLSGIAASLQELTHKGTRFEWLTHHEDAFT